MIMDKNELVKKLTYKKIKDYSYTIIFFLIFSFFLLIVIKPNLTNVASLQVQLDKLTSLDNDYSKVIAKIVDYQADLENLREDLPILDEALPNYPAINRVIGDLTAIASDSGVVFKTIEVGRIELKENINKNQRKNLTISFTTESEFPKINSYINLLINQRRLKTLQSLLIDRDQTQGSQSAVLKVKLEVNGYYL